MLGTYMQPPLLQILEARSFTLTGWNWPAWHFPYWRMYWADRPGTWVTSGRTPDSPQAVGPRHLVLVPPELTVALHQNRPVCHAYCHFTLAGSFRFAPDEVCVILSDAWMRGVQHQFIEASPVSIDAGHLLPLTALIWRALAALPASGWRERPLDPRIQDTLAYIELHLDRPVTVRELASRAALAPGSFARLFRQHAGQSLHQYLLARRVQAAGVQLLTSDDSIKQIATRFGFCDRYHFSRVFRRHQGVAPGAYRVRRGRS